ncbi:beta-ketoacyl synthase N-terminal-like domain-containing protein [Mycobacterium bourgelatii]|uniref:Ketosynthase family 3 (KS3) domain-containing protein n=1 Tax=Mycobacterium bourgelatii TaxID=1273442 RepID=A0A7I9YL99_MYCBU|nr:beta-ketoacyl synthase N-terminal-like domain-containing protein [Mycobacterium bourgelatii]MCV6977995.1 polyketide synthase dehydratase domain-containing protein [Mycobacterium bourgelatii]GFG89409.1 hypothetical protein MBOU_14510 [Mycobacterium bourgelatii]
MKFEPIAIVGQGCVLPGGLSPDELWTTVLEGRDVLGPPQPDYWRIAVPKVVQDGKNGSTLDHAWSARGGYVRGFDEIFDAHGLLVGPDSFNGLDPLFLWVVEAGRQALESAGWRIGGAPGGTGVILGNLTFPTRTLVDLAENYWRGSEYKIDWRNRFMSAQPAHLLASALGLTGDATAIEAGCASSLYAIKLACDRLHDRTADVMLAGGVNGASDLLIHVFFTALHALSRSGQSRPFDSSGDGVVPAEGAAILALRRLEDAVAEGNRILGVIRGIGLSNDGRGRGLLVPFQKGQERAMRLAYAMAQLEPQDISFIECHATGTPRGDLTELTSMSSIFAGTTDIPIGSLKSNLGHTITASGAAGIIKVLAAMRAGIRPPTLHVTDPLPFIADSPFRVLTQAESWACDGPRRAAISNFGFGGNNAHLLLEEWVEPADTGNILSGSPITRPQIDDDIAIVGLSLLVGDGHNTASVAEHLKSGRSIVTDDSGMLRARMAEIHLDLRQASFPPCDLNQAQPQQLALLSAALDIDELIRELPPERTSVVVGMGCDTSATRSEMRVRLAAEIDDPKQLALARDNVAPPGTAASVVGAIPNIVANRLNSQFDLAGPSFTVYREELSGITALKMAARSLQRGEVDAAVVGAVDLSCEPIHEEAARVLLGTDQQIPGDAAVVMVVKRAADARRDGDCILATLPTDHEPHGDCVHLGTAPGASNLSPLLGHSHAASGLLHVAAGVLYGLLNVRPDGAPWTSQQQMVVVALRALGGQNEQVVIVPPPADRREIDARAGLFAPPRSRAGTPSWQQFLAHLPNVQLPAPTQQLEEPMTTCLPVPPPLPKAQEAERRVPLGAALIAMTPVDSLTVVSGDDARSHNVTDSPEALPPFQKALAKNRTDEETAVGAGKPIQPCRAAANDLPEPTVKRAPVGLTLDNNGLLVHSSGRISDIFGPRFKVQDDYHRQVRMPAPPMLLADRVLGIDAEPGKLDTGVLWTETDVTADGWWLHQGRMPAGIMIESGQADLMLISWMGIDSANKGDRVYRLLGFEVTFLGGLPEIGDTLRFDIHVDGHARQGDIRMFFFHYDCTVNGVERMLLRNGQAGFFSDEELAASRGILWRPEDETVSGPMDSTPSRTSRTSLDRADLEALAAGKVWQTFGHGFERAGSHTRTPCIAGGDMLLLDAVTELDFKGGPWGRGYLRAVSQVTPDDWYFTGHFKNDPCMPGTLMYEATLQAMAIYMTALGMTIEFDGWRFEPVPYETYKMRCRGQVTPQSRELVYEVFVRELIAGPEPTLFADLLCTVDGLPAFHCRRMGVKLSPGWLMDLGVKELEGHSETSTVAEVDGFRFDYRALLSSAIGRQSEAFGPLYQQFDTHRRMPRLPGPPYHFVSRVTELVGDIGVVQSGAEMVVEYDVPSDAWFFGANGTATMPNAVLMEVALQPCGFLANYIGCPLSYGEDVYFRNLDGTGQQHRLITPSTGTLRTRVRTKNVAKAAGVTIVSFSGEIHAENELVYTFETVFGYFGREALQRQVGLPVTDEQRRLLEMPCDGQVVDLRNGPLEFFGPGARLAESELLMIDRVTGRWPTAGTAGLGRWRAVKDIDPAAWFFKAHFYQDPVQPGSLGIEMLLQLLQFAMLDLGLGKEAGPLARFEPVALREAITWKYRGQVVPTNKQITSELEITGIAHDNDGILAVADAFLWVDGKRIYSVSNLAMRITGGAHDCQSRLDVGRSATAYETAAETATITIEKTIDPARDTWITDHCPTFVIPCLPMMSVVDLFAQAGSQASGAANVVEIADLELLRWITVDSPKRLRVIVDPVERGSFKARLEVWRDAPRAVLSRWETHAYATIVTADRYTGAPTPPDSLDGSTAFASPYDGTVFHGPAFACLMDGARIGRNGSSGALAIDRCKVPVGQVQPGLLDGALHIVPHTAMSVWATDHADVESYQKVKDPDAAFPRRVLWARFYSDVPVSGTVDVEARFVGFDDADCRMPVIDLWLSVAGTAWAQIRLAEILLPLGSLAGRSGPELRAFLGERRAVPRMSLSERSAHGVVTLDSAGLATLGWFKDTLNAVYHTDSQKDSLIADIAIKEAVADAAHNVIHPSQVQIVDGQVSCPTLPLEQICVEVEQPRQGGCRASASLQTDWEPVLSWSNDTLGTQQGDFADLLHWALLLRYVRHVIVTDPAAMSAIRGRPVLLLGNHQVQIESVLGTAIASWVTGTKVVTVAHAKHETGWIGELLRLVHAVTGTELRTVRYFDQRQPRQFFDVVEEIKSDAVSHAVSTMVHADGTRYVRSGQRVERVTSTLLDTAIDVSMPIVPVYFAGGLPEQPVGHKLEVPYRHAAQDYIFGRPILPDELRALPYAHRRSRVLEAINDLAPFSDAPNEPNYPAESRIAMAAGGASPLESIWVYINDALDGLPVDWRTTLSEGNWPGTCPTQGHFASARP